MNRNVEEYLKFKRGEIRFPGHLKPMKVESARLYKNIFIEKIMRSPFWIPQYMWILISAGFIWYSFFKTSMSAAQILITGFIGFFVWTFMEYIVHRFLYHTEVDSESFANFQMDAHGNHHLYPKDAERLAMPPIPGLIVAALLFGLFYIVMGEYAFAFFPGFLLAYDMYITLHYYEHRIKSPKYQPWKKLWRHHKAHHYSDPYSAFGVSTRFWDWIFGTMPQYAREKKKEIEVSAK